MQGEDGTGPNVMPSGGGGFEFGVDPNEDPELALALRVSMEEQRARQQERTDLMRASVDKAELWALPSISAGNFKLC